MTRTDAEISRRTTIVGVTLALLLVVLRCGAARADNYTYKRTRSDDARVGSMTLRKADLPATLGLTGGRIKPDETSNNDSCNGYIPKQSDLIVTGDAESRFLNGSRSIVVDSEVEVFQTSGMAATDVQRGKPMLTPACEAQSARQGHIKLVSYKLLGRPQCSCDFAFSAMLETKSSHPNLDLLFVITGIRKGRFEATVFTTVGKSMNSAQTRTAALSTALAVQALAVRASLSRLHAN